MAKPSQVECTSLCPGLHPRRISPGAMVIGKNTEEGRTGEEGTTNELRIEEVRVSGGNVSVEIFMGMVLGYTGGIRLYLIVLTFLHPTASALVRRCRRKHGEDVLQEGRWIFIDCMMYELP